MSFEIFAQRRKTLVKKLSMDFATQNITVVLFSGFALDARYPFRPNNDFFYFTGVTLPGICAVISAENDCVFFTPDYAVDPSVWESMPTSNALLMQKSKFLGQKISGYAFNPKFSLAAVENLRADLEKIAAEGAKIFTSEPADLTSSMSALASVWFFEQLKKVSAFAFDFLNCEPSISSMRLIKDAAEIWATQTAVDACVMAQQKMGHKITTGVSENFLKHQLQAEFDAQDSSGLAFSSIVASGKNSTVLHHTPSNKILQNGELVVVDIGCEFQNYTSDLTRTFPVGGKFSARQKEIYNLVLDAQKYAEAEAKPGVFLRGHPESLHQKVVQFFEQHGVRNYFLHGLGHYVGLDVHDVGSYQQPLEPGMIFTIEPGLYLAQENIGIRIEDNYLMTSNGALRLSKNLAREADEIEKLMS